MIGHITHEYWKQNRERASEGMMRKTRSLYFKAFDWRCLVGEARWMWEIQVQISRARAEGR